MNLKTSVVIIMGLIFEFMLGCSDDLKMVQYQREENFFDAYKNPASDLEQAATKIESIKLLQTSEDFPIRLALFDNGKFYYQVDELGSGIGDWKFEDGGLTLTTRRKIFDMSFYLSAAGLNSEELLVKFFDRHGFNEYSLNFRNPQTLDENGTKPEKLREFKASIKDI